MNRAVLQVCYLPSMPTSQGAAQSLAPVRHLLGHKMEALNNQGE